MKNHRRAFSLCAVFLTILVLSSARSTFQPASAQDIEELRRLYDDPEVFDCDAILEIPFCRSPGPTFSHQFVREPSGRRKMRIGRAF